MLVTNYVYGVFGVETQWYWRCDIIAYEPYDILVDAVQLMKKSAKIPIIVWTDKIFN